MLTFKMTDNGSNKKVNGKKFGNKLEHGHY